MLEKLLLRVTDGGTIPADQYRVHIAHARERAPLTAVTTHHVTTAPTVVLHKWRWR